MRRLLVVVSILVLAPMAFGNLVTLSSGGKTTIVLGQDVEIGDVITVDLTVGFEITGIGYVDFISSATYAGDVRPTLAVGAWQPCFQGPGTIPGNLVGGDIINAFGVLTAGWSLGTGGLGVTAGTVLYSFNATVNGTGQIDSIVDRTYPDPDYGYPLWYDPFAIIIPEPMTIALLGLGGLFLAHRRK